MTIDTVILVATILVLLFIGYKVIRPSKVDQMDGWGGGSTTGDDGTTNEDDTIEDKT